MPPQEISHFSSQWIDEKRLPLQKWKQNDCSANKDINNKNSIYWVKPSTHISRIERYNIHDTLTQPPDYHVHTIYKGDWLNNMKHGRGEQYYTSVEGGSTVVYTYKYVGEWKEDKRCGQGELYINKKYQTIGERQASLSSTTATTTTNQLLQGGKSSAEIREEYRNRYKHTPHMDLDNIKWIRIYKGEWQDDKKQGIGEYYGTVDDPQKKKNSTNVGSSSSNSGTTSDHTPSLTANTYHGEWYNNMKHGYGRYTYSNGDLYEGQWWKDQPHGYGRYIVYNHNNREPHQNKGDENHNNHITPFSSSSYTDNNTNDENHHTTATTTTTTTSNHSNSIITGINDFYSGDWFHGMKHGPGVYICTSKQKAYVGEWYENLPKCGSYMSLQDYIQTLKHSEKTLTTHENQLLEDCERTLQRLNHEQGEGDTHSSSSHNPTVIERIPPLRVMNPDGLLHRG